MLNLAPVRTHLPKFQFVISVAERVVRIIEWFRGLADYRILRFRRAWSECVELACNMLIDDFTRRNAHIEKFRAALESLHNANIPASRRPTVCAPTSCSSFLVEFVRDCRELRQIRGSFDELSYDF
jgi:hypothetical protein